MKRLLAISSLLISTLLLTSCRLNTPIAHHHTNNWNRVHCHKEPNTTLYEEYCHHPRYHHSIYPSYRYRDRGKIIKERFENHSHARSTRSHNSHREPSCNQNRYRYHNDRRDHSCRNYNYQCNDDRQKEHCDRERRYNNQQHRNRDIGRIKNRLFKD